MTASNERRSPSAFARHTRHVRQHPRLAIATLLGIFAYLFVPVGLVEGVRLLVAFDLAAAVFLAVIWTMMARASTADMRRRSRSEDEGRYVVLALSAAVACAILLSIAFALHGIHGLPAAEAGLRVGLAVATILLAWFFMNTMFALHYAHVFYDNADDPAAPQAGGLAFPGGRQPDYWDFLYFSFTIGMTFQVSDVQIESHSLRRTGLAHGVLAFFFNVVVLALTINIIASLI
jgi:uncharacterized membrane protein